LLEQRAGFHVSGAVGNSSRKIEALDVIRLNRYFLDGVWSPHRGRAAVSQIPIACGPQHRRSSRTKYWRGRVAARLSHWRVVNNAGVYRRAVAQLETGSLSTPGSIAAIVLQKLVVADAGARQQLEINPYLISFQKSARVL